MKVSVLMCASIALFAAASLSASAAPSESTQKGPSFFRLTDDPAAEQACRDKGGAVSTDQDGYKICKLAHACPVGGATRTVKLDAGDPSAAKKCQDTCGVVSTDAAGAKVCTKPEGS